MQYPPSPATNAKCVHFCLQMQPLTGALPCGKGHLQSIPLERKLCFGLCHCGWLKVRRSPLFLRLSSVTGILGWIIRLSLLLLKNTRSWGESLSTVFEEITSTGPKNHLLCTVAVYVATRFSLWFVWFLQQETDSSWCHWIVSTYIGKAPLYVPLSNERHFAFHTTCFFFIWVCVRGAVHGERRYFCSLQGVF